MKIYVDGSLTRTCVMEANGIPDIVPFKGTVNEAEYEAILRGLEYGRDMGYDRIDILSDSQLVVRQLSGQYKTRKNSLLICAMAIFNVKKSLALGNIVVTIKWIPREKNQAGWELEKKGVM